MAASFSQIKARLGSTRLILQDASDASRTTHSKLQREAVQSMVKNAKLDSEQRATLAQLVASARFCCEDERKLLDTFSAHAARSHQKDKSRRSGQEFIAFLNYLSDEEWQGVMACTSIEECIQMFLIILLHRFQCVNPCEYTHKRMAASARVVLR